MFKKKQSLLVSRPRPPSLSEVTEDIGGADEDDVVFDFSANLAEEGSTPEEKNVTKPVTERTVSSVSDDTGEDDKLTPMIENVYHQVRQFLNTMTELKSAPETLQALYGHLKIANQNLQESIKGLQQKADELSAVGCEISETAS